MSAAHKNESPVMAGLFAKSVIKSACNFIAKVDNTLTLHFEKVMAVDLLVMAVLMVSEVAKHG